MNTPILKISINMAAAYFVVFGMPNAYADSLFNAHSEKKGSLVSNNVKEFQEGDIINVLVRETIDASTQANTNTTKKSNIESQADAADNGFLVAEKPGLNLLPQEMLPNWKIESDKEQSTKGNTARKNTLVMTLACQVKKVYDNGNIDIEGEKTVTVNREDCKMFVSGRVRSKDVTPANTVDSTLILNAQVKLDGKGPLWNNQRRGWITKFLDWFSPY